MPFDRPALTTAQIDLLQAWIEQGAVWEEHWSYTPVQKPVLPAATEAGLPPSLIDYFVQDRLQKEGLPVNPRAGKTELLRRASLDLTGLPPTV